VNAQHPPTAHSTPATSGGRPDECAPDNGAGNHGRAAAVRASLDDRARTVGYAGLETLICVTADRPTSDAAALLGTSVEMVKHWRRVFRATGQARAATRRHLDEAARAAGYADLATLIRSTADLPTPEVSALMGKTGQWARHWRDVYTTPQQSTDTGHTGHTASGPPNTGADEIAGAVQPGADGAQRCRSCGTSQTALAWHVREAHGLSVQQYRDRYTPAATTPDTAPSGPGEPQSAAPATGAAWQPARPVPAAAPQRTKEPAS
jgi:hypothetical protein